MTQPTPRILLTLLSAVVAIAGCDSMPAADGVRQLTCEEPENSAEMVEELLGLVNEVRARHGSFPLTLNPELSELAATWACTMAEEDFFGHSHPNGDSFADRWERGPFGHCHFGGENLAVNYYNAEDVFRKWMVSRSGHREEILQDQYQQTGIAIRTDGINIYWVEHFLGGQCEPGPPTPQDDPGITGGLEPRPEPLQPAPSDAAPVTADDPLDEPE